MSASTTLMLERAAEIAASAAAEQIVKRAKALSLEPSSKRYHHNRAQALEAWSELRELAATRAAAASKAQTARRPAPAKPKAAQVGENATGTNVAAA